MNYNEIIAKEKLELKGILMEMDKIKEEIAQLNSKGEMLTLRANEKQARIDFAKELMKKEEKVETVKEDDNNGQDS
jgi:hypothetical protein